MLQKMIKVSGIVGGSIISTDRREKEKEREDQPQKTEDYPSILHTKQIMIMLGLSGLCAHSLWLL